MDWRTKDQIEIGSFVDLRTSKQRTNIAGYSDTGTACTEMPGFSGQNTLESGYSDLLSLEASRYGANNRQYQESTVSSVGPHDHRSTGEIEKEFNYTYLHKINHLPFHYGVGPPVVSG